MEEVKPKELLKVLDRISQSRILVVGDIILDRYIWGRVDRISQEAPVPIVEVSRTEDRLGGAGNVIRNLQGIGVKVSLCGYVGNDLEGRVVVSQLKSTGVDHKSVFVDKSKPTIVKTRVIAHHQQVVRIDREDRTTSSRALDSALCKGIVKEISKSKAVVLADYGKGAIGKKVLAELEEQSEAGHLGLETRPLVLDPHPRNYGLYRRVSVVKPNRKEAEIASGVPIKSVKDAFNAARELISKWQAEMMVVTLSEDGMIVLKAGDKTGIHLETTAQEVFDVSGAGDTVTAVFSAALSVGASPREAGMLANLAAGIVVSEVGTVAIDKKQLREAVLNISKGRR